MEKMQNNVLVQVGVVVKDIEKAAANLVESFRARDAGNQPD